MIISKSLNKDENLVLYDKDNLIHISNENIINLKIDNPNIDSTETIIEIIARLNNFNNNEFILYRDIILNCVYNVNDNNSTDGFIFTNKRLENISLENNISLSTIKRAIETLLTKNVIKIIKYKTPNVYNLTDKFNIYKNIDITNPVKAITILID